MLFVLKVRDCHLAGSGATMCGAAEKPLQKNAYVSERQEGMCVQSICLSCRILTDWIMAAKGKKVTKGIRDVLKERGLWRLDLFVIFYFLSRYVLLWQRRAFKGYHFLPPSANSRLAT